MDILPPIAAVIAALAMLARAISPWVRARFEHRTACETSRAALLKVALEARPDVPDESLHRLLEATRGESAPSAEAQRPIRPDPLDPASREDDDPP